MKIYKYAFPIQDRFEIEMPIYSEIIKVEMQGNIPCLWAIVNPGAVLCKTKFVVIGTGQEFNEDNLVHISTFQQGEFVWHLFEEIK